MTNKTEISVVIPVKNEAGNIDQLIKSHIKSGKDAIKIITSPTS